MALCSLKSILIISLFVLVTVKSLPIDTISSKSIEENSVEHFIASEKDEITDAYSDLSIQFGSDINEVPVFENYIELLNNIRPGQEVESYAIELTVDGDSFNGRAVLTVLLSTATREDDIILHAEDLEVASVRTGLFNAEPVAASFNRPAGRIEIIPAVRGARVTVVIEYSGQLRDDGFGLFTGEYDDTSYVGMNLHPTYARHVFPCMDEPTEVTRISFTFKGLDGKKLISNSAAQDNHENQFRAIQGPPHLWGMLAHDFNNLAIPVPNNAFLWGRQVTAQDGQATLAINYFYNAMNQWTNRQHNQMILDQNGGLHIVALPDVDRNWNSLSIVGIWEPHIFMETAPNHAVKQRKTALIKIGEGIARQWFGYLIFPENFRFEWITSGLATYSAYELLKTLQTGTAEEQATMLDVNTLFLTDIIQESLLRDAYATSRPIDLNNNLFDPVDIRLHIYGLLKYKAPALMRMWRLVLGNADRDFMQIAARTLSTNNALQPINTLGFIDAINSEWLFNGINNGAVGNLRDYIRDWIHATGYPLVTITKSSIGVMYQQTRFGFTSRPSAPLLLPLTFTTSINPDFSNIQTDRIVDNTDIIRMNLDEEDWVIFNIQGQGYYRVNYSPDLWTPLIDALDDPDSRNVIHPLNRATLLDDSLNIARSGTIAYDIALSIALAMEHETEYAPWKSFVRNMEFLRKRLIALALEDDDYELNIYTRMIARTVVAVESELGFRPAVNLVEPPMRTLTRGLVMEHACKADYAPCVAAAVDWFYNPNSAEPEVNPNIPHEIRPAVYCTMVREGDEDVITALNNRLEIEPSHYERVVILESLGCSQNANYINSLLAQTIAASSPYMAEEKVKIFTAIVESSRQNARLALRFIRANIAQVRSRYGGDEKIEELIFVLAENMLDAEMSDEFRTWVLLGNNNLNDNLGTAERAVELVDENERWIENHLETVYEWIDENDAPTLTLSILAIAVSMAVALLIQ